MEVICQSSNNALRLMTIAGFTPYLLLQKLSKKPSCLFVDGFTNRTGYAPYDRAKDAMVSRRMFEIKINRNRGRCRERSYTANSSNVANGSCGRQRPHVLAADANLTLLTASDIWAVITEYLKGGPLITRQHLDLAAVNTTPWFIYNFISWIRWTGIFSHYITILLLSTLVLNCQNWWKTIKGYILGETSTWETNGFVSFE